MELETHVHVWYGMVCRASMVWYDVSVLWYMLCYGMLVLQGMEWYISMVWYVSMV